jgi:hypothetical protein
LKGCVDGTAEGAREVEFLVDIFRALYFDGIGVR